MKEELVIEVKARESEEYVASERTERVRRIFGIPSVAMSREFYVNLSLNIRRGDVVLLKGPSGSGKSTILKLIKKTLSVDYCAIDTISAGGGAIIDDFESFMGGLYHLVGAGLADAYAMMKSFDQLSEGQKYRDRLAIAMERRTPILICDEFASSLDDISARLLCHRIRKMADLFNITIILSTNRSGLEPFLFPNITIETGHTFPAKVSERRDYGNH